MGCSVLSCTFRAATGRQHPAAALPCMTTVEVHIVSQGARLLFAQGGRGGRSEGSMVGNVLVFFVFDVLVSISVVVVGASFGGSGIIA